MLESGTIRLDSGTVDIRKTVQVVQQVFSDGPNRTEVPVNQVAVGAVVKNPYVDVFNDQLTILQDLGSYLGDYLMAEAVRLLPGEVKSYGKAGVVGGRGELEHVAAILHPKFGKPTREQVNGVSILPSVKKRGAVGCTLDIPLHHKTAMLVRDFFDSMIVSVHDAPLPDEVLVFLAVADHGRPHARMGGLSEDQIVDMDGLR